jgi:hypothetical protein
VFVERVLVQLLQRRHRQRRHRPEVGRAGYNLYLLAGQPEQLDLSAPHTRLSAVTSHQFTDLAAATHYTAAVVARSRFGRLSSPIVTQFDTDAAGTPLLAPAAPRELRARALPAGNVELTWLDPADGLVPTAHFRVFEDHGTGTVDYDSPIASVSATGRRQRYRLVLNPGRESRTRYSVRAASAALVLETNTVIAECVPDATGPAPLAETPTLAQL